MGSGVGSGAGFISQKYGSADPDPHQNVTDVQHWFYRSYRSCFDGRLIVEHVQRVRDVQVQTLFRSQPVQRLPAARLQRKRRMLKGQLVKDTRPFQIPNILFNWLHTKEEI